MPVIIIIIVSIFLVLAIGTWHCLGSLEKNKKILFILIGVVISYLITFCLFSISKSGITYPSSDIEKMIKNVIVAIFSGLNGIILFPYLAKLYDKVKDASITKEQFQKRLCIFGAIVIVLFILECNYLKGTQVGILEIYQKSIK